MGDVLKKRKVSVIKILTLEKVKCKQRNNYENTKVERDPRDHKAKNLLHIIPTMNYQPLNEQKGDSDLPLNAVYHIKYIIAT